MAFGFQPLSCDTMFEKHWNSAELPIIFFAVAWAEAAEEGAAVVVACAGAAAISVPHVAAVRAAPTTAFFGVATERRRETADTGGLSVGSRGVAAPPCGGGIRRRLATAPQKQIPGSPAKVPFTTDGRRCSYPPVRNVRFGARWP
ncbi:hypothetical protein GCM10018771_56950 [Streptomyces cellulosae]|nr:hypothetical protein GCM10018771_56950 [Streptomyces cellulosae]